jgi:hypothetical protein
MIFERRRTGVENDSYRIKLILKSMPEIDHNSQYGCGRSSCGIIKYGGPDGIRTRDLRRDRPAF